MQERRLKGEAGRGVTAPDAAETRKEVVERDGHHRALVVGEGETTAAATGLKKVTEPAGTAKSHRQDERH